MRAAQPAWCLHPSLSICFMDSRNNPKTENPGAEMDDAPTIKVGLTFPPSSFQYAPLTQFAHPSLPRAEVPLEPVIPVLKMRHPS